jgi:flagellar basal-body rod protein FlgC
MNFLDALHTSATGLSAQRFRMNLISSNLANVNTTKTKEGGPYKRKDAIFRAVEGGNNFNGILRRKLNKTLTGVEVTQIVDDSRPPLTKHDPGHPDADQNGYVAMPNINIVEEMVNMISASRSYEANVTAVKSTKDMAMSALEIGR